MDTKTNMIGDFEDGVRKPTEEKRKKEKEKTITFYNHHEFVQTWKLFQFVLRVH
jgi:hypothetical protein